jgi:chromosome segregation ATPase
LVETIFRQLAAISAFRFVPGPIAVDALDFLGEQKRKELESMKRAAQELGDYEQFVQMWEKENAELKKNLGQLKEENAELRAGLQLSQENLGAMWRAQEEIEGIGTAEVATEEEAESIEESVLMAQSNFSETLVFLESALTSAQDSPYKHPKRVSQALLAMA